MSEVPTDPSSSRARQLYRRVPSGVRRLLQPLAVRMFRQRRKQLLEDNEQLRERLRRLHEERDRARSERDEVRSERDQARTQRDRARGARDRLKRQRDEARDRLHTLTGSTRTRQIEQRLWAGFSTTGVADLRRIQSDRTPLPSAERLEASFALARWHASQGELEAALTQFQHIRRLSPFAMQQRRAALTEIQLLCYSGQLELARDRLEALASDPHDAELELIRANTQNTLAQSCPDPTSEAAVLAHVNRIYEAAGAASIRKRDPGSPLTIDNLVAPAREDENPQELISVIVPAHDAEDSIVTALTSLAEQTWTAIEVFIIDDASTDATADRAQEFAAADSRFHVLRQDRNLGNYTARNIALSRCRGAFITVHDADDWSHPQKLALQVRSLIAGGHPFNLSEWARATPELLFTGFPHVPHRTIIPSYPSIMYRREVFDTCGRWHEVRISGDTEFLWRAQRRLGVDDPPTVRPLVPLAIGRDSVTSLTRTKTSHIATMRHGVRREYRESARAWHETLPKGADLPQADLQPRFPVPGPMRAEPSQAHVDALLIADWGLRGGAVQSARALLTGAQLSGLSTAVLNYPLYRGAPATPVSPELRRSVWDRGSRFVAPGEELSAKLVIVTYPAVLEHRLDLLAGTVDHEHLVVVVNQLPERDEHGLDRSYEPGRVLEVLNATFGHIGAWVPISPLVRRKMSEDPRLPEPHPQTWYPLTDVPDPAHSKPNTSDDRSRTPIIGRHGRDHWLKWPTTRRALLDAYCADQPCEVRILGGAEQPRARIGSWPTNWEAQDFGEQDVPSFLSSLDFLVHHPNETYIEEFGRVTIEAMAAHVPVILPPRFQENFGEAAVYAEPADVWPTISRLWEDADAYNTQVAAGHAFIDRFCSYDVGGKRLRGWVSDG